MCGRYTLTRPNQIFTAGQLQLPDLDLSRMQDAAPRYNVAPTDRMPIVRRTEAGNQVEAFRWGLIPFFAKDPREGARMINARAESVADKPAFRRAFRERRCLVPADGFFEWEAVGKSKQAWYIRPANGAPFLMAGLWERWRGPLTGPGEQEPIHSFSILTTAANPLIQPLHERMPVILPPDAWALWLDNKVQDPELLKPLLLPFPADGWTRFKVGRQVNKVGNDDPSCILPQ